jgi:hypothetical protein
MNIFGLPQNPCLIGAALLLSLAPSSAALAQKSVVPAAVSTLSYADMADLSLAARLVAHIRIRKADPIKPEQAPGLLPGRKRYLVEADVLSLIRGEGGLNPRITFLADMLPDARGKIAKLTKAQMIVFAVPDVKRTGAVRLVTPDAMIPALPDTLSRVRGILTQAGAVDAPPPITAVTDAYHVAGTVAGEGETQVFLQTANGGPVSLSIVRVSGLAPSWSIALGEVVDQGAPPPARNTLLWYRLACFLPRTLPPATLSEMTAEDAESTRQDYSLVMAGLGTCPRTLRIRP